MGMTGFDDILFKHRNKEYGAFDLRRRYSSVVIFSSIIILALFVVIMLIIEMEITPESYRCVSANSRIFRFLGGKEPVALSQKEIDRILGQVRGEVAVAAKKSELIVGGEVTIQEGPFDGFVGVVDKIDEENEKVTVMVSIFGRMTPVELNFNQVKQ